jgi:hypothetical protein
MLKYNITKSILLSNDDGIISILSGTGAAICTAVVVA